MIFASEHLANEYDRWIQIVDGDPFASTCVIGVVDVLKAHFLLLDHFFSEGQRVGGIGPRSVDLLQSAVGRQIVGFGGKEKWADSFDKCATLFYGLIKNHPFHDCNKRTALLIALYYLTKINRTPSTSQKEFENLTLRVAESKLQKFPAFKRFSKLEDAEIQFISNFLRRNTRTTSNQHYNITFNQLRSILARFGYRLAHPSGNYIDVVRETEKTTGLIFRKTSLVTERVTQIGFPGWKSEVSRSTIKRVREATKLTHKDGTDSEAFFHDVDSMAALISAYRGPLERLANK